LVGKKLKNMSTMEKLAVLAVSKATGDNIGEVSRQVISDYFAAVETIKNYKKSQESAKAKYKEGKKKRDIKKKLNDSNQAQAI